jgi:hypothetical protein
METASGSDPSSFGPAERGVPEDNVGAGHYLAALGALALIASLFMPWFGLALPAAFQEALDAEVQKLPAGFREFGQVLFTDLPEAVEGSAWELFSLADVALLVCGVAVLVLVLLATGIGRPAIHAGASAVAHTVATLGVAAAVLILLKMADQPEPRELFEIRHGALLALAGALTIAVGGWLASTRRSLG